MDRDNLHAQLVKLGDMMGDGLHHEEPWISREYKRVAKLLYPNMYPKKDYSNRNAAVAKWCELNKCRECGGTLSQTRSGSFRVKCEKCDKKFQLSTKKK